jgi:hypothetical protein
MGDIQYVDGFYNEDTGDVWVVQREFIGDVIAANIVSQKDGTNGWSEDRSMRRVGFIPWSVYASNDFNSLDKEEKQLFLRTFLENNPQYRTVERLKTSGPSDGHIIVK